MKTNGTVRINIPTTLAQVVSANKPETLSLTNYIIQLLEAHSQTKGPQHGNR